MDTGALHTRREARRRAVRRRRQAAGLIAAATIALAVVLLAGRSGDTSQARRDAQSPRISAGAQRRAAPAPGGTASAYQTGGPPGTEPVPILMYHVIASPPTGAPFPGLYVSPSELAAQVQALKRAGWHAVTLDQMRAYWKKGVPLGPGKPIVLSFDNGYHSQYTQALPILRRVGWVGDENIQLSGLPPSQGGLDAAQVRALLAAGWELDTQGFSHADLIALDAAQLHYEVVVARRVLQQRYGVPVNWFCYPSGHYNSTVLAEVKAAGYAGSTTVVAGWSHPEDDPYRLHRLRVLGGTSPQQLLALIASSRGDPSAPSSYNGA